ncbi:unnamed protein product [Arctia plantaginis]|uniref:Uncharacterized protein n=1 Tax=Arctia plantaginis TaxID=874455 RepID=A0A8S1A6Y8_ARCPL|nr:unnamed protein product [Arctia plantaginis]
MCSKRVRKIAAFETGPASEESRQSAIVGGHYDISAIFVSSKNAAKPNDPCLAAVRHVVSDSKFKFEHLIRDSSSEDGVCRCE